MQVFRILLSFLLLTGSVYNGVSQTTHIIHWNMTTTTYDASPTIQVGDTVEWILDDDQPHSVTSTTGSVETFDSGILNPGATYKRVFNVVGENPYYCEVHPTTTGVITVKGTSSLQDETSTLDVQVYPNPSAYFLNIKVKQATQFKLFNLSGKLLKCFVVDSRKTVDISKLEPGIYLLETLDHAGSIKIIKL